MIWINVIDRLPIENNAYLVFCKEIYLYQLIFHISDAYFIAYFCDGKWKSREEYNCEMITHWTFLPNIP